MPQEFRWRRVLIALLLIVGLLGVILGALFSVAYFGRDILGANRVVYWRFQPGSTTYVDPEDAWTVTFPDSWPAKRIRWDKDTGIYTSDSHGVFVSNIPGIETAPEPSRAILSDPLPAETVAVRVSYNYGGGFTAVCDHDTPLPLSLADAKPPDPRFEQPVLRDEAGGTVKKLTLRFSLRGEALYSLTAWIGSRASAQDLATLDEIVESVWYVPTGPPQGWRISGCEL
jgi:hypothetical protein